MIQFLIKGIFRDKSRSLMPVIVITIGVAITVMLSGYIDGSMSGLIDQNARFETGHLKVVTQSYFENRDQSPVDLALLGLEELVNQLESDYPDVQWVPRTRFGGIVDVIKGDSTGRQSPTGIIALSLFDKTNGEHERFDLQKAMQSGVLPTQRGQVLLGTLFAERLEVNLGDSLVFFGSTMEGSITFYTLHVTGTIRFGMEAMDRNTLLMDISDAQQILDMENGSSELLGFLPNDKYDAKRIDEITADFHKKNPNPDQFDPIMIRLKDQNGLASYLDYVDFYSVLFVGLFVFAMSVVLWNTGLLGGLRRYQEFGIRLALGESKGMIYKTQLLESIVIGVLGSIVGTTVGLAFTLYLQEVGIDISEYLKNSSLLMPSVLHSTYSTKLLFIGFIPGLFAIVFGTALSGIGIFKRETANLCKELEV